VAKFIINAGIILIFLGIPLKIFLSSRKLLFHRILVLVQHNKYNLLFRASLCVSVEWLHQTTKPHNITCLCIYLFTGFHRNAENIRLKATSASENELFCTIEMDALLLLLLYANLVCHKSFAVSSI